MKYKYQITVGMPVWGVEKYIERCIESILDQDFDDMEVLVVDDCGPDKSLEIAERIKKSHPKGNLIRIIRQPKNMGCWAARNRVLEEAQGKYILLVDSDDYLAKGAIPKLYKIAEETGVEATYGSILPVDENGNALENSGVDGINLPNLTMVGEDKLASYANSTTHRRNLNNFIWNILIRKDFIDQHNLRFKETKFWDDVIFNADMQPLIQSATFISDITYNYVIRANSLSNFQQRKQIKIEEIRQYITIFQYLKKQCLELKDKSYFENRITKIMLDLFYILIGAIRNKEILTAHLGKTEFRNAIHHPLKISEIIRLKKHKLTNLLFWTMGVLPPTISYYTIIGVGRIKHLI
jgi:glycosyltransferase involved in cell wall biosynthesis